MSPARRYYVASANGLSSTGADFLILGEPRMFGMRLKCQLRQINCHNGQTNMAMQAAAPGNPGRRLHLRAGMAKLPAGENKSQ